MKKKTTDNLVTEGYLDKKLAVQEKHLDKKLAVQEEYIDVKLSLQKDEILGAVKDMFTESNSKLYTRIDPLLAEIDDNRVDRAITTEKLENHEKRLKKLERN